MNALADPFKQLVERRLWPVAVLLVAALVAVPLLLTKKPAEEVLPPSTVSAPGQTADASLVTLSDADRRDDLRAVLGSRKNPFRPAQLERIRKPKDTLGTAPSGAPQSDAGPASSNGGGGGGGSSAPSTTTGTDPVATPVATATPTPAPKTFELYSLKVRFGLTSGALATRTVKRLSSLPGGVSPALLYLGVAKDKKSAVFIVDAGVETVGDGTCEPSPDNCETLTLKPGDTEFLTRGNKQWELDLLAIRTSRTHDAKKAAQARAAVAADGRGALRRLSSRVGAWSYDASQGTLRKLTGKAYAQRLAKATRRATFSSTG